MTFCVMSIALIAPEPGYCNCRYALPTADDFVDIGGSLPIIGDGQVVGTFVISSRTSAEYEVIAAAISGPQ